MISNARGKHSSPGVYIEEIDKTYATKSLGITTLGVVGETLKGPAFEPIDISDWAEFQDYFGGTSTEKFKGTNFPKYELPYIAKSYLEESKQLQVCRVLGFSGYNAGPAWALYASDSGNTKYVIGIIRSKGSYNGGTSTGNTCNPDSAYDVLTHKIQTIEIAQYSGVTGTISGCTSTIGATTGDTLDTDKTVSVAKNSYGRFNLTLKYANTAEADSSISVSLNPSDKDFIVNVIGMSATDGDYDIFVEEFYDLAYYAGVDAGTYTKIGLAPITGDTVTDYKEMYREAITPWFVSELKGNSTTLDIKKLFRFHTISDGNAANSQIKVSIANILPDEGFFDVLIRDFYDTDNSPLVLERYNKCSMVPGTSNYIGLKIGTYNGDYALKSKYVTVEVIENDVTETCVPCGFLGYPLRDYGDGYNSLDLAYNTEVFETIKPNRQYFGMSDIAGVDFDVLAYKGKNAYKEAHTTANGYTNGFHLDSLLSASALTYTVDGATGFTFTTVNQDEGGMGVTNVPQISTENIMKDTLYADKRMRKFTCYPYGGFDGWDIYREARTNTDEFRANKYKGQVDTTGNTHTFKTAFDASAYGLTGRVINSDYYAYLAGYKQFENPHKVEINLLATPGIDYVNNLSLVNEVLDIIEDSRQGDCLYIVTTPDKNAGATDSIDEMLTADEAVANFESSEINTSYAATYFPWVKYYDAANKKYINLPVTKDVVRNFAHTDNVAHPWFASAGMSRGNVDCVKARHFTKLEEEDILYEGMINPVKSFGSDGVKIWGNKTMYLEDTPLNRINVRRLMIRVKGLVSKSARQLVFEQNDNTVEAQFRSLVDPILANAKQNRGLSDYKIKTDTSAEARDRHELPAKIWVKPINCLEYIPISFVITPEGANFED